MDIVEATNDFQDWEVLQPTFDSESAPANPLSFDEIDSGALIQVDYFSLEARNRSGEEGDLDDEKSGESDNPSWIDPGLDDNPTRYLNKDAGGEFWSDSSSERSEDRKSGELICGEVIEKKEGEKMENLGNSYSDSSGIDLGSAKLHDSVENSEAGVEVNVNLHHDDDDKEKIGRSGGEVLDESGNNKSGGELGKRNLVWWKMPMEFLKYFLFRMSPVWTVSMAAAAMGFVLLGRRLYTMKKKTKALQIKVTVDDKKVSQVMSRAARLNEAFSVVKRVPVIRPSLPAIGVTPWPVMSLR
ncbi:hypothetical protein BUALT_Bualt08G0148100 [Buddleja alternifolia]|uniref:DUF6821 domain-containing protein n=1 Tax=Buddleja alternifolia TaxID=168488 RepID=A0AAV6XAD8_9LAMI|nr:hypothetical protein BUALT_Bualt08G0148100 [Buddleja alternifolia]